MRDRTFNLDTLGRMIQAHDFHKYENLYDPNVRQFHVEKALQIANDGFTTASLRMHVLKGKLIYQPLDLSTSLVLRKISGNITRVTAVRQQSRVDILKILKALCTEGVPFCVHKIDIKSFYESVPRQILIDNIFRDIPSSPTTLRVLKKFFEYLESESISGLPRGIGLSAILSEYLLRDFDQMVKSLPDVYYYARYVDDMVIISRNLTKAKMIQKKIVRGLPEGLEANYKKTRFIKFNADKKTPEGIKKFDFLGHEFSVSAISGSISKREVNVDISESKIKKIKTRIVKSIQTFNSDHNFKDLEKRMWIISANHFFFDHRSGRYRGGGIYHNYKFIDETSKSLQVLDDFLRHAITSGKGKVFKSFRSATNNAQRSKLMKCSFQRNFEKRKHYSFNNKDLERLMRCWKYAI